jgi:hypothetical protein
VRVAADGYYADWGYLMMPGEVMMQREMKKPEAMASGFSV